jgi:hypothetical protein
VRAGCPSSAAVLAFTLLVGGFARQRSFVRVFGSGQNISLQDPVRGCRLLEKALQRSDEFALSVNLAELLPVGRLAAWAQYG